MNVYVAMCDPSHQKGAVIVQKGEKKKKEKKKRKKKKAKKRKKKKVTLTWSEIWAFYQLKYGTSHV